MLIGPSRMGVVIEKRPLAIAVVYVKIFIEEPGLRGGHTARLYWPPFTLGLADETMAMIAPLVGSIATRAPCCTRRHASECCVPEIASWPICWSFKLSVVCTRSPPPYAT